MEYTRITASRKHELGPAAVRGCHMPVTQYESQYESQYGTQHESQHGMQHESRFESHYGEVGVSAAAATEGGPRGREPGTQGERIYWVRLQRGPKFGEPQSLEAFARDLAGGSGEEERSPSTILRWENDEGRGPTLKEGVVIARWAGQTAEWLSAVDVPKEDGEAKSAPKSAAKEPPTRQAVRGQSAGAVERPRPAARKQGHGRGRRH
jgi:hypothetical protein